ncbi:tetratricopeptide repeat-containing glycosyltransferase family 2 protein [Paenibacillus jilunlii]|uniref:tetratricopeptide repeat-containing glycosyltransferase family 2 protein n=1 Tax=Paenibacillus jilunlii TaxID=682956 RepID=UPI000782E2A3|nr:glycosyltransferase family 2 protein [Paenibacillus jilunlii]
MSIPDLSLCMIVKNEAQHLERCLSSVAGLVSEIIIADTGSSDSSMEIARSFGARVLEISWEGDFALARNLALQQASCPWILVLDADEAVSGWRAGVLNELLGAAHVHGYFLPFIHYVGEAASGEYVTDNVCRLFRNDERIRFRGTIHEEAASSIWALAGGTIAYAALPVHHYGYLEEELRRKDKTARNLKLIHEALRHDPASIPLQYALGTEYYQLGEYGTAADVLLPLLKSAPAGSGYLADIFLKTAYALQSSGRREEAKGVYKEGLRLFPDFTDLLESCAALLLEEGQLLEPYHLLQKALESGDTSQHYPSSSGSGTSRTSLMMGQVCERLLRYEEAADYWEQAIGFDPSCAAAWAELVPLCLLAGAEGRLIALTRRNLQALPSDLLGRCVPAALNAHAWAWLQVLSAAPQLPASVQPVLRVLPELSRQHPQALDAAAALLELLREGPEQPSIHGYLWAWACRTGDAAAAGQWLASLAASRPGLAAVRHRIWGESGGGPTAQPCQRPGDPAAVPPCYADHPGPAAAPQLAFPALSYAAQLLLQAGAWSSLLTLYRNTCPTVFQWCRLPQPLLRGLIQAPVPFREQWCSIYSSYAQQSGGAAGGPAEWLLYAAIAASCGRVPQLAPAAENALRQSKSAAAAGGLSYHKLLLAAEAFPDCGLQGRIPWLLLVRTALRDGL